MTKREAKYAIAGAGVAVAAYFAALFVGYRWNHNGALALTTIIGGLVGYFAAKLDAVMRS